MQKFIILTTIDITPSGTRHKTDDPNWWLYKNQQRNWDTLMQVLSLRCQPMVDRWTITTSDKLVWGDDVKFYTPNEPAKIWLVEVTVDRTGVIGLEGELFLNDIDGVPIVPSLTETSPTFPSMFFSKGDFKNIDIIFLPGMLNIW